MYIDTHTHIYTPQIRKNSDKSILACLHNSKETVKANLASKLCSSTKKSNWVLN